MDTADPRRQEPGCQPCLLYALFVWVTILSLGLAVALTLILTASPPPAQNVPFGHVPSQEITMEIGKSSEKKDILPWAPGESISEAEPLSVQREHLVVKKGRSGCYFLYLRVTLPSVSKPTVVPVVWVKVKDTTVLEGVLTNSTTSGTLTTGFLGRQVRLYEDTIITVSLSYPSHINTSESATYLGVYLLKQE